MSLGKDLASIRKGQNLTLEDIQNAVKIPLDTLQSIEDDSIFDDSYKNKTYVRSFVRSYAKELKLNDDDVVQALDEVEEGTYAGSILRDSTDQPESFTPSGSREDVEETVQEEHEKTSKESFTPLSNSNKPKITATPPADESFEWADLGNKFSTASKSSRIWIIAVSVILILGISGAGYYFLGDFENNPENEQTAQQLPEFPDDNNETVLPPTPADTTSANSNVLPQQDTETPEQAATSLQISELGDTLTVAVYAAYGQLEPIRVTSDLNWTTNPFWMEEGEAYNFDFRDTLLVRGQYSRLLLLFNGHVIENPRQNYYDPSYNSIMITRDVIDQSQFLEPAPIDFPLEVGAPDSIIYRIRF
jgi:cytoskeletal protein RodZ